MNNLSMKRDIQEKDKTAQKRKAEEDRIGRNWKIIAKD